METYPAKKKIRRKFHLKTKPEVTKRTRAKRKEKKASTFKHIRQLVNLRIIQSFSSDVRPGEAGLSATSNSHFRARMHARAWCHAVRFLIEKLRREARRASDTEAKTWIGGGGEPRG